MAKKKQTIGKKLISWTITVISLAVFLYASHGLLGASIDYYQNRKLLSNVQDVYHKVPAEETSKLGENRPGNADELEKENIPTEESSKPVKVRSEFDELLKQNDRVVGWITIDDTHIDYPILHSEDNIDFLTEDYDGKESSGGSIFLDYRNDIMDSDKNTVVYGHRMKDGSMFQHLTKFLDEDFFDANQTFTYDTLYDSYTAEIFSVYNTLTDFNYIETDFDDDDQYEQLLSKMKDKSRFNSDVEVSVDDDIITLSTCDYELDENDSRLVVHARLTPK